PAAHGGPSAGNRAAGASGGAGAGLTPSPSRTGEVTSLSPRGTPGTPGSATSPTSVVSAGSSPSAVSTAPGRSSSSSPAVRQGTLTISPATLDLVSVNGTATGQLTITASGGPVSSYSITAGSALAGHLTVSPASGSLTAGQSVTITVTSTSLIALDGQLTVNPGAGNVTVLVSVGL
ncbi:MAG: hypothetical protein M3Z75_32815, partial [Actinomycetota bacterium]|nr:hypothetical protein [Actinomycetota bacterium]